MGSFEETFAKYCWHTYFHVWSTTEFRILVIVTRIISSLSDKLTNYLKVRNIQQKVPHNILLFGAGGLHFLYNTKVSRNLLVPSYVALLFLSYTTKKVQHVYYMCDTHAHVWYTCTCVIHMHMCDMFWCITTCNTCVQHM